MENASHGQSGGGSHSNSMAPSQVTLRLFSGNSQVILRLFSGYSQVILRLFSGNSKVILRIFLVIIGCFKDNLFI